MRNVAGRNLRNTKDKHIHTCRQNKLLIHLTSTGKTQQNKTFSTQKDQIQEEKPGGGGETRSEYTDLERWSSISTQVYTNLFLLWGESVWKSTRISINCHSTWISVSAFYQLYCICRTVVLIWSTAVVVWCRYLLRHVRPKVRMPGSDEAGVLEELDEDLVDKLVLGDGLHHQHPLLPQPWQHGRNLHWLRGREEETDGHWETRNKKRKWGKSDTQYTQLH